MRVLKAALRRTLLGLATVIFGRWVASRFWRTLVRPTDDATLPIGPDAVVRKLRRVIVSDLHLGAGDRLEDFDADAEFVAFVRSYVMGAEPTELILAGDTFEFLQVRLADLSDFEWSAAAAARRLDVILHAHRAPVAALRDFVAQPGNQLTVLIGNHDFELHYAMAKARLRQALGLAEADPQLRFGLTYTGGGIYVDHGMQFDPWNRFANVGAISEPFEVVSGTRLVKEVINPLEDDPLEAAPLIDNVKPISAFLWYMLSLPRVRQLHVLRFMARGLLLVVRTHALPRRYALQSSEIIGLDAHDAAARRRAQWLAVLKRVVTRWLKHDPADTALAQIQQEAKRQLRREMREFKDAMIYAIAQIAASSEQSDTTLFVCGHTHSAQVLALNKRQTYINTGTWTAIVLDIATNRREEQRFPFLEVSYQPDDALPRGQLLVWCGADVKPFAWLGEGVSLGRHTMEAEQVGIGNHDFFVYKEEHP